MGGLFSSSVSNQEGGFEKQLEKIDSEITVIDIRRKKAPQVQKNVLSSLFYYSLIIELLGSIIWYYFHQKPIALEQQVLHASPLVVIPVLYYLLKWTLQKHYQRSKSKDEARLTHLKGLLKAKLEERKKATAFDSTQNLLKRYGRVLDDETNPKKESSNNNANSVHRNVSNTPPTSPRNRDKAKDNSPQHNPSGIKQTPNSTAHPRDTTSTPQSYQKYNAPNSPPKGVMDRFVDYLLSTGPKYGFALVCGNCKHHNGFAPPGEEDMQFRCRICGNLNQRGHEPIPPVQSENTINNTPLKSRVPLTPSTPFTPS